MHLLYYWKPSNYRKDSEHERSYTLVQNSEAMKSVEHGETLWAFTRNADGRYVLAAALVIDRVEPCVEEPYGRYCAYAIQAKSRYFDVDAGRDVEGTIRGLSVAARAAALGQSFQGSAAVRELEDSDHASLTKFATDLPEEDSR